MAVNIFFIIILIGFRAYAHDTIIIANNFKYKVGVKFIVDTSNDYSITSTGSTVISGGIQFIRKLGDSRSSIETGIYEITKALGKDINYRVIYNNISIPINYRFDTKVVYISGGFYADYLIDKHFRSELGLNNSGIDRKLNFGFNLCLGIEKEINRQLSLAVEARTFNNLTSSKTDRGDLFSPSYSNNGFAIGINYKLLR